MPSFLLDTNVVSELVKRLPEQAVLDWVATQPASSLYLAVITLGELVRGVVRLGTRARRDRLQAWLTDVLPRQFEGRILAFDREAAVIWGRLLEEGDRAGRPRAAVDAQIAAISLRHDLVLVTRNTSDFEGMGARLVNPWP
jgi:predicted nucleic acid-binding protein